MTYWVCKFCIMHLGIHGSDLKDWPKIDDVEAQARHIETVHNICVRREGETEEEAWTRFEREHGPPTP